MPVFIVPSLEVQSPHQIVMTASNGSKQTKLLHFMKREIITVDDLYYQAKKLLAQSSINIAKESQDHTKDGGGKEVRFYKQTKKQAESGIVEGPIFYGNPQQAKIFLRGLISVFAEFKIEPKLAVIPEPVNETYFPTQGAAVDFARQQAGLKYYKVQELGMNFQPLSTGQSARYHLELSTQSELKPEMLHVIIYRMESGKYELTHYIN